MSTRKKVLYFIHGLNTGGAETLVKEYALRLNKGLFDVQVFCLGHEKDSPYENVLSDAGVKVVYLTDEMPKLLRKEGHLNAVIRKAWMYYSVRKHILQWKPDVLHTHLVINMYIWVALILSGIRPGILNLIHTVHGDPKAYWTIDKESPFRKRFAQKRDFFSAKWLVKHYSMRFIALHDDMRQELNELFHVTNSIVINNGIDFSLFDNTRSKQEIRKDLGIPDKAYVIGHVGRFSSVKNHGFLLNVYEELCKRKENCFLLMVGTGEGQKRIREILNNNQQGDNYLILENRTDVSEILRAMDCFVFPSLHEGLGIALIEAQRSGIPCFASTAVPPATKISNLITYLPLDKGPEIWAETIANYTQTPVEYTTQLEEWDIRATVQKLEKVYLGEIG